jgi:hypothetical protein
MQHIEDIEYPRGPSIFNVFVSYFSRKASAYRVITNNDHFNSYLHLSEKVNSCPLGEDPRPFVTSDGRFILSQRVVTTFEDMHQNIINYDTGEVIRYIVDEPNFNYGKNWTPFVYNNSVFFIHCFDPFTVIHNGRIIIKIATNIDKCGHDNFTAFRGGSNGIIYNQDSDIIYGIGHYTIKLENHNPFIWVLNLKKNTLEIALLSDYIARYIIADPTGLWQEDGETYLSMFESSKGWFHTDATCVSRIFRIDFPEVYTKMKMERSYKIIAINLDPIRKEM